MAPAQFTGLLLEDITFTRSGQSITPTAIDIEDGWENAQDLYINRCEISEHTGTADIIINAAQNVVMTNNRSFNTSIFRSRIHGLTIKDNDGIGVRADIGTFTGNTVRIFQNQKSWFSFGKTKEELTTTIKAIQNEAVLGYTEQINRKSFSVEESDVSINGTIKNVNFIACNLTRDGDVTYIDDQVYFAKCYFLPSDFSAVYKFSFNVRDATREFRLCTFDVPVHFANHNYFNSGLWEYCTFKESVKLTPKGTNNKGQIQFNYCHFEKDIELDIPEGIYVTFNHCTFNGEILSKGTSQEYIIFNQ